MPYPVKNLKAVLSLTLRYLLFVLTLLLAIESAGCSWPTPDGSGRTHLVLGLGFIQINDDIGSHQIDPKLDARAQRFEATGALLSFVPGMSGLLIGHTRRQTLEIVPKAEIIIDVHTNSDGIMHISAWRPEPSIIIPTEPLTSFNKE